MIENLEEAKQLVMIYKSLTIEDLETIAKENAAYKTHKILTSITNFGHNNCILCCVECDECIHSLKKRKNINYYHCINETYRKIEQAETIKQLYNAINKRADYLLKLIDKAEQGD